MRGYLIRGRDTQNVGILKLEGYQRDILNTGIPKCSHR